MRTGGSLKGWGGGGGVLNTQNPRFFGPTGFRIKTYPNQIGPSQNTYLIICPP